jgi:hypothetical protein
MREQTAKDFEAKVAATMDEFSQYKQSLEKTCE